MYVCVCVWKNESEYVSICKCTYAMHTYTQTKHTYTYNTYKYDTLVVLRKKGTNVGRLQFAFWPLPIQYVLPNPQQYTSPKERERERERGTFVDMIII